MRLTNEQREQVIELRRRHSLNEVASLAGLPLGTVKAIVSRSGLETPGHVQPAAIAERRGDAASGARATEAERILDNLIG